MFHRVELIGNLSRDPETRFTPGGQQVTTLNMATNRTYTDANGQQVKETVWWRVSVWGKMADACAKYLSKGKAAFVEGRMNHDKATGGPRVYQRQDGTYGAAYEITATNIKFLGGRSDNAPGEHTDALAEAGESMGGQTHPVEEDLDVPF